MLDVRCQMPEKQNTMSLLWPFTSGIWPLFLHPMRKYIPGFDGVRGLGLMVVMLGHYGKFQGAWVVLSIFFSLSGYLITHILLAEKERQVALWPYLRLYLRRRSLRIFPVYYLYLLVVAALWVAIGLPQGLGQVLPSLFGYWFNIYQSFGRTAVGEGRVVGHLWSLCVEEQFYLIWPFAVWFLSGRGLKGLLWAVLLAGPLVRWGMGQVLLAHYHGNAYEAGSSLYIFTTTHLDAIAGGALLAAYKVPERVAKPWRWVGLAAAVFALTGAATFVAQKAAGLDVRPSSLGYTLGSLFAGQHIWGYTVINAVMASLTLALVVSASTGGGFWGRLFAWKPFVALGKVSYGMYIWHYLAMVVLDHALAAMGQDRWRWGQAAQMGLFAAYVLVVYGIGLASYYGFEQWFLKLKDIKKAA